MPTCQALKQSDGNPCGNSALQKYGNMYCGVHRAKYKPVVQSTSPDGETTAEGCGGQTTEHPTSVAEAHSRQEVPPDDVEQQELTEDFDRNNFSSLGYIGSKLSLLGWVLESFNLSRVSSFAEPMCGTGVVSDAVLKSGCIKVYSNDICNYASTIVSSRILPFDQELYDAYLRRFMNGEASDAGFVYKNLAEGGSERLYFSAENAKKIDGCRKLVEESEEFLGTGGEVGSLNRRLNTRAALIATILLAADRVANTASVYAAFLKNIKKSAQKEIEFKRLVSTGSTSGRVSNLDAIEFIDGLPGVIDLIYLDPPYTNRGYCSNYHVLETISLYDEPALRGITGLRDDCLTKNGELSKKSSAFQYFRKLMEAVSRKCKVVVISYSSDGIIDTAEMVDLLSSMGKLESREKEYKKFTVRSGDTRKVVEYLFKCSFLE
jgi:adenine-specific DNA-methyltransferase